MIANARMYSVAPAIGDAWKRLFERIGERAGLRLDFIDYPAPAPLSDLWARQDMAAVFMCGLPYSLAKSQPEILVAPVPSPTGFDGKPQYWTDFVVRADSPYAALPDTFGRRLALTVRDSQSGYIAPLRLLKIYGGQQPLFDRVIEPRITPVGAITAVIDRLAEVAPVDAYAFQLLKKFRPELTSQIRVIARTDTRPIPFLAASPPRRESLASAFLTAHQDPSLAAIMSDLLLTRFVEPDASSYAALPGEYQATLDFWRSHPLATDIHQALIP
ncbi:MAG: hypothetical protein JWM91_5347 [Rhodospirillales bacterium]|nr:hypothetical protein [Rhodospirillales bacterium]